MGNKRKFLGKPNQRRRELGKLLGERNRFLQRDRLKNNGNISEITSSTENITSQGPDIESSSLEKNNLQELDIITASSSSFERNCHKSVITFSTIESDRQVRISQSSNKTKKPTKQKKSDCKVNQKPQQKPSEIKCFICDICGETFTHKKSKIIYHMQVHMGLEPFKCKYCGKKFVRFIYLRLHVMRHGKKNLKCNLCNKTFHFKVDLKNHIATHESPNLNRIHVCHKCGASFKTKDRLKRHLIIHLPNKPYICEFCGKQCTQYGNLKIHMLGVHKDIIQYKKDKPSNTIDPESVVIPLYENYKAEQRMAREKERNQLLKEKQQKIKEKALKKKMKMELINKKREERNFKNSVNNLNITPKLLPSVNVPSVEHGFIILDKLISVKVPQQNKEKSNCVVLLNKIDINTQTKKEPEIPLIDFDEEPLIKNEELDIESDEDILTMEKGVQMISLP